MNPINFESVMKVMKPVQKLQATFTTREQYDLLNEIIVGYSSLGQESPLEKLQRTEMEFDNYKKVNL